MAVVHKTASCQYLAVIISALCLVFIPSGHSQELEIDNVVFTELDGLPLVEQSSKDITVDVSVGTTNVITNGVEQTYPGDFLFNYTLASGSNASNAMHLQDIYLHRSPDSLSPGTLYTVRLTGLTVSLTNYNCDVATLLCVEISSERSQLMLTGSTKGCIQITCRGVVITFVEPAQLDTSMILKQGVPANSIDLTVSFNSAPTYASVAGMNLWDPLVFGNGNQFGTTMPRISGTPTLVAVSNYGISNTGTSVWPQLTVSIDLTNYGCPEAQYICVNPQKAAGSSVDFTLSFVPPSAQYGCVEVDCAGVEFIDGTLTSTSQFAEFRSMHEIEFTATFNSDSTKGGVIGTNLWTVKAFASMDNGTSATPISENDARISANERSSVITSPGDSLIISGADVELDLSGLSCNSLVYLCVTVERNPSSRRADNSALNFTVTSVVLCEPITCIGLDIKTLTLTTSARQVVPLLEYHPDIEAYYVDLTIEPEMNTGAVTGSNLWSFDIFFSDMADCSSRVDANSEPYAEPADIQTDQDVDGQEVTIDEILIQVSMSNIACENPRYLCMNLSLTSNAMARFRPLMGATIASLDYNCRGIQLTAATLTLTSPASPTITERTQAASFTVNLTVTADDSFGSVVGDDLWTAVLFLSPNMVTRVLESNANTGMWQSMDVMSGSTATFTGISATINLTSTCDEMKYLCVQLSKNTNADFTFDINNNVRVACIAITTCYGVVIAETNLVVTNPNDVNVIENTNTVLSPELRLTGMASTLSANLMGVSLWKLNVFTSSNGIARDGGVNMMHDLTPLQEQSRINSGAGFDFTMGATIDLTFDMSGQPCDKNNFLCVEILKGDSPDPDFSLSGNTTGCFDLSCKGIIVTNTNTTITSIPNGGILVEGFANQMVNLAVALTTDAMGAQGSGTGLWQLDVFTNAWENGTGDVKRYDATLTSGAWIDVDVPAGATTTLTVPVYVDLSGSLCMDVNYLCVRIREGVMPSPNITLQYSTGPENFVGCAPVTCESAGIERNGMSFTPDRIVEHQVAPEPFTLSVSYISEPDRDNITGTNLWGLKVFFADSENGTNPSTQTQVDLGAYADSPFYSGQTLDFNDLMVNVSLVDFACYMNTHFCTQLEKGDPSNENYTLEIRPACMPIQCAGIALNSTEITGVSNGQLLFEHQSSQRSVLDITLNSLPEGASLDGTDLWNFAVFLSNSNTMFNNREAVMSTMTYASSGSPLVAGTPLNISGVETMLDLSGVGCRDFRYICVQVGVSSSSMPTFNLDLQVPYADIGCAPVDCRGVQISVANLNLISGEPLVERVDNHMVTFAASLQFSDESTEIYGSDLWQATIFTNSRQDGGDARCASSDPVVVNGNVTRGQMVSTGNANATLNISQCICSEMQYLCMLITMNPDASVNFTLENPSQGFLVCQEVNCTGVVINQVDLTLTDNIILYEADPDDVNVTANVVLTVSDMSAEIIVGTVTNIWQFELYPLSDPTRYRVGTTLDTEDLNRGLNRGAPLNFDNLFFEFRTYNFVCPENGTEELCVEVSTSPMVSPNIIIEFQPDNIDCVTVVCRGVMFENLVVAADTDSSFVEFESMHQITFNISATPNATSTTITGGLNLWEVCVYASLDMNGLGERYSKMQIPIPDTNATVLPSTPVEYAGIVWNTDLTNFTCPSTNQFYMCVQLMPGSAPVPNFSMSPRPLQECVEIDCTGVVITMLDLTVNSGDPVLERNINEVNLTVTATSSPGGSSINGTDLWNLVILLCERDQCASARRRRRATNPNALVEITANLTTANVNEDLAAGGSITFANVFESLDLTSFEECPASEMVYIYVQLEKGDAATPDYSLQGDLLTCQSVQCRGVHIASSSTDIELGTLQEGNPSNAIEIDFSFTTDALSADVTGTDLWALQIYGSNVTDGSIMGTAVTLGNIGSVTNVPLAAGESVELRRVMTTIDLSPYITCEEAQYVCGRLVRNNAASQIFSVTGERTACHLYDCTGVQISGTTVAITNDASPTEGQSIEILLNVTLTVDATSSSLTNVMDGWGVRVHGNTQLDGLGDDETGRYIANTSMVGDAMAMPGMMSTLNPVSVLFDLTNGYCGNIENLCIEVERGPNAMPPFKLSGVPSDYELTGCIPVDCIGVRINSSTLAIIMGDPVLQGSSAFEVAVDVDYVSDETGADVTGTDIFGVQVFLSSDSAGSVVVGNKSTADIPDASQSTTLRAGEELNINRAIASINTMGLDCQAGALYLCAELFRPANASYKLNGYNSNSMVVDDSLLIACQMVECRDLRLEDMTLSSIDPPCIIERTDGQLLTVNVTVQPNATWSNVSGSSLWMMNTIIRSGGQADHTQSVMLSTENADRDVVAGTATTFPNVELSLDLSNFFCPDVMVELCVSISPSSSADFSINSDSVTEACVNVPCKVTEIDDSNYEIFFPPNILEYETNNLRFAVSLTAASVSASIEGDELWQIVRVYMSGFADGNDSVAADTSVPLLSSQDEVGISAGETVQLLNIQATLDLQNLDCASMPYLCVEVAKGDAPSPEFNVSFNNNSNIICEENDRCQGIVITSNTIQSPAMGPDADERLSNKTVSITLGIEHDPDLGTSTGDEVYPWMITVFYNNQSDCMGDDFGAREVAPLASHQMLIDNQPLVFANLEVELDLSGLICPDRYVYLCAEFAKNSSLMSDYTLNYEPQSARYAVRQVPCHGVEFTGSELTLTDGIEHEQEAANHEVTFTFKLNSSESTMDLSGNDLWSFLIYGSRNSDGSGDRVINHLFDSDLSPASIGASMMYELSPAVQMVNLSFDDIECVEMPYLCVEIQKNAASSVDFSLWGVPDDSSLRDCFELDCRGVFIDEFNISLTPGDDIVYENDVNSLTAVDLSLSSRSDNENATGTNLWKIFVFFSDEEDGTGVVIARTEATPLPAGQADQDFIAGNQIRFGPLDIDMNLQQTCEGVLYLCFELEVDQTASAFPLPVLLGMPVSCVPVDCRGVVIANTNLQVNPVDFTETEDPIPFVAMATVTPHSDSADLSGTNLWSLDFFLSDSPTGNASFERAPPITRDNPLSVGSDVRFMNLMPVFNASRVLCYEALYLCMELRKNSAASPEFGLSGLPDDSTLLDCAPVTCIGVVVASTDFNAVNNPVLLSGEPNVELGTLILTPTFASRTRSITDGNNLFSIQLVARGSTGQDIELDDEVIEGVSSTVLSGGMPSLPWQAVVVDLTGIRCDQMTSLCAILQKGPDPDPDYTLQGEGGDQTLLEDCIQLQCRGVQVDSMFVNFVSGVPLLEDTAEHEVNFTLNVETNANGADAAGNDLWSLSAFLSRYENGSNPISRTSAYIGDDANLDLPAGGSINIDASVNLNASDLVCDTEFFLCVVLSKGDAVTPDYTLEGVGTFSDLQICQPFICRGVNLTNANLAFTSDNVLRNFDPMSEVTVNVSVDVVDASATVSGRDLWHLEFFTSTDSAGNVDPSARAIATNLTETQGSVSLVAGETSDIIGVSVVLDLSSVSCTTRYLCVEVWRGQRAFPFYSIESPASQAGLRSCRPIDCVGVEFIDVTPRIISPPIWIEDLSNQSLVLEIDLEPDSTKAGIVGESLFEVDVFASASNTGTEPQISLVTVAVSNAYASNLRVDRFSNTTLTNVQALVDFSGFTCSDLMYVCVEVRKGPNAVPDYILTGGPHVGCTLHRCAGVIVNSITPTLNLASDRILLGDSAHTFQFSVDAMTGNGIMTPGAGAWQIEVFVSSDNLGTNPLRTENLTALTAPSAPNAQIEFSNQEVNLNLSGLMCSDFSYFCIRLSAPGANFTLGGSPTDSALVGCYAQQLECREMSEQLTVESTTDTTLTVEWGESIGDFDSYRLSIAPGGPNSIHTQIKSNERMHTFMGLTPGANYTVTLQLLEGSTQKGAAIIHQNAPTILPPSCPDISIPDRLITSREITVTWTTPLGSANVDYYTPIINPNTGVTNQINDPFNEMNFIFSALVPGQMYEIEVRAFGRGVWSPIGCNRMTVAAKPATVMLSVTAFSSTSVTLAWQTDLAVTPTGYMLDINILSNIPDASPSSIDIPETESSYVVSPLLPGVEYNFTLVAYQDLQGTRVNGDPDTVTQRTIPAPPENIVIDVTESTALITYQAPPGFHRDFTLFQGDANSNFDNGIMTDEFRITYTDLDPGTEYSFRAITNAGSQMSPAVLQPFTTRPTQPGDPVSTSVDETTISIGWPHNDSPRDNYEVIYSPNNTNFSPQSPSYVIENAFTLRNLDPYTTIEFEVRAVINSVTSLPATWRQRSFAARPGVVQNLTIVATSSSSVNVIFEVPSRPNGLIEAYIISYSNEVDALDSGSIVFTEFHPNDVRIVDEIMDLNPGVNYVISVQAVNEEGTSDIVSSEITLQSGDPVPSGNAIPFGGISSTATTITIVIPGTLFSEENGVIIAYQVFVSEEHPSNTDRTITDPPLRYQQVVDLAFRLPYVTSTLFAPTPFVSRRKRQIENTQTTFTVGIENECVSADDICNGPLEPLTSYRVLIRAYTDGGSADSPWSAPISTSFVDSWFTIPVIVYGIIIFLILIFMLLCCLSSSRHRRKKVKSSPGPRKTHGFQAPHKESRFNDNHNNASHGLPKHSKASPAVLSRPVLSVQFSQHYNEMIANKQHKFTMEFDDLRNIGQEMSKSVGRSSENKNKNRFGNILPYNETRVELSGTQGYINANYITGFNRSKEYIATQGPMRNTVNEFWRMVWEKECPCIVMLVRCIEGGKEKCDKYWPTNADPTVFGKVIVTKLAEHNSDNWAVRDFRIKVGSEERLIRQYHFTSWPTHSTPKVSQPLLHFVMNIRKELESAKLRGPAVVHCGAGIGRTGVFIALDILIQEMKADQRTVDVFAVVAKMRRERCTMVQSLVQYIFLHRALADFLRGQGPAIDASSIERSDAGSIQSDEIEEMSNTSL